MAADRPRIGPFASFIRPQRRVLADLLPPFDGPALTATPPAAASLDFGADELAGDVALGWVSGVLPSPFPDDRYIVQFMDDDDLKILAYIDGFGRAFSTDEALEAPPASEPDLAMRHFGDEVTDDAEDGCILVKSETGEPRRVASYVKVDGLYEISDSWYDFGEHDSELTYTEIMTRAYVAFVYRPTLTAIPVPSSGLATIHELLASSNAVRGLRAVEMLVQRARSDAALRPPALAQLLVQWLEEAGFTLQTSHGWLWSMEDESDNGPLRLIRTRRYANTFYVGLENDQSSISRATVWAIESALNRFLLVEETLGSKASTASRGACIATDEVIRSMIAVQAPAVAPALDAKPVGEWRLRSKLAKTIEELRVPYRFEARYHSDLAEPGVAAFLLTTPNAAWMARERYDSAEDAIETLSAEQRQREALAYACNLAVIFAASAFATAPNLTAVAVTAQPADEGESGVSGAFFQLRFDRDDFIQWQRTGSGVVDDPAAFVDRFATGAFTEPFALITARAAYDFRKEAPEIGSRPLRGKNARRLGAETTRNLRINYDANLRHAAERLAHALDSVISTQEAIRLVRKEQNATGNPYVFEGCTKLMTALTQGNIELSDRDALIACFTGNDPYAEALRQARASASNDPDKAAAILADTLAEAEASGRFTDTGEAVHRMFDSYAGRVIYNLHTSDERTVELLPPSLVMCYLDAINLFDERFATSEQAVAYGKRCIEVAPTFTLAYRRCARAYMLTGDLDGAANLLMRCLGLALVPEEIAMAYYQLAYVLWKSGANREGAACYCKSIVTSPIYAAQASMELRELMREEGLEFLPGDDIDGVLEAAGVPLAPRGSLLDEVWAAIRAAVDENLFEVAKSLLLVYLRYRPDDALADVLRSLEDPRLEGLMES